MAETGADWRLVHAGAVLLGTRAVLVRGASGAGKSQLGYALVDRAAQHGLFARLVADDYLELRAAAGRLVVRVPPTLAGLMEIRGVGIMRLPAERLACVGLVVDLLPIRPPRLPEEDTVEVEGVRLPRLAFGPEDNRAAEIVLGNRRGFFAPCADAGIAGDAAHLASCPPLRPQVLPVRP